MKKIKVGINGFGRIGRIAARIAIDHPNLNLVAINSRADALSHAYLLKYDSTYGTFGHDIKEEKGKLLIDNEEVFVFNQDKPDEIPWRKTKVDIVIDSSGKFLTEKDLSGHIRSGAKYVILSAPARDFMKTIVKGVNEKTFHKDKDLIISNSSCTTNCLATTLKVLDNNFTVLKGFMTTVHALTDSQNLLDNSHSKEIRLRRSSLSSLIPASTGSAKDIGKLFPKLSGKILCSSIRVPIPTVSLINLTVTVKKSASKEEVNNSFLEASKRDLKNILSVASDELVSKDFTGNINSAIIDPYLTQVMENCINIYAWYDNEWGYTNRLVDMVYYLGLKGKLI